MVGIDLVNISKIRSKKERFLLRVFTKKELDYSKNKANPYQSLAGIFAAKEAVIKAYGLSLSYIIKKRIEIKHIDNKPCVYLDGKYLTSDLSISHDGDYAIAICTSSFDVREVDEFIKSLMPTRNKKSHKGDYGKIAVLGGSLGMSGSVYLSSKAALRSGAGLVYIICPSSIANILEIKSVEQIILPIKSPYFNFDQNDIDKVNNYLEDKDVLALGPGMGIDKSLNLFITGILNNFSGKVIIDADGLNAISKDTRILKNINKPVLTPHLKEFERLIGVPIDKINENRLAYAKKFAKQFNLILVLKSENTIVTDGNRVYINEIGNPGMATAGSGDVLTGIIASLLHRVNPFEASCLGVYIHSLAGDLAAYKLGQDSILASDIIDNIPEAMKILR